MGIDKMAKGIDDGVSLAREDHGARGSDFDGGPLSSRYRRRQRLQLSHRSAPAIGP